MSFISFRSNNFPTHYLRHQGFRAKITELGSALDYDDASFRIVDGLDRSLGGGLAGVVSLESKNFPGHFLRHRSYELWADKFDGSDLNAKDASFRMVVGLADPTGFSFEAVNFPGHFLRHSSFLMRLDKYDGTPLFAKDATFHLAAAGGSAAPAALGSGVSLRSVNYPSHFLRHQDFRCKLTERHSALDHEDSKWFLVDGRDTSSGGMRNGYVSLQSGNFPKRFLRHRSYEGWLDENDGSPLFAKDSTFKVVPGLANPRAVSFEAVNFPGHFLRHSSFLMRLDRNDGSPLFAADASFFLDDPSGHAVPAHHYGAPLFINLTSHNFPHMSLRHQSYRAKITELHSPLDHDDAAFHIVDGLDAASGGRVAGAISFESKNFPGHFLRHRSFEVWLDKFDGSDLNRKDATFYVRRGLADPSGVSFEAVNFPGHFVRHSSYVLRLDKYDGTPLFSADATFKITDPASHAVIPITGVVGTGFGVAPVHYGSGSGAGAW